MQTASAAPMRAYLAVLSARFRSLLQYRAAALAGVVTQIFFGYIRMMIFDAFYHSSTATQPMTREQTISYIWLGQAMLLLAMFNVDSQVAALIRTGDVAYELARPVDLYWLWFSRALSGRAAPLTLRAIPILLISFAFFGLQAPASFVSAMLFLISIVAGILLCASLVTLITITMMWSISGEGVARLTPAFIFFFSGMIIPLPLFPDWLQPLIKSLPFRGLIDVPFRLYLGNMSPTEAALSLLQQSIYITFFVLVGRWALARGTKRLVVQGG